MKSLRLTALTMAALALSSCSTTSLDALEEMFSHLPQTRENSTQSTQSPAQSAPNPTQSPQINQPTFTGSKIEKQTVQPTVEADSQPTAPTYYHPTTSIPGRSGLRMGSFVPPEEAASTRENAAPAPNAVELHGLRSPALPTGLPLDINGQSKKD